MNFHDEELVNLLGSYGPHTPPWMNAVPMWRAMWDAAERIKALSEELAKTKAELKLAYDQLEAAMDKARDNAKP